MAALVIGALVVRTAGVYFIMVTLAFAQMIYFFFHDTRIAGGSDGIYVNVASGRPSCRASISPTTGTSITWCSCLLVGVFVLLA